MTTVQDFSTGGNICFFSGRVSFSSEPSKHKDNMQLPTVWQFTSGTCCGKHVAKDVLEQVVRESKWKARMTRVDLFCWKDV